MCAKLRRGVAGGFAEGCGEGAMIVEAAVQRDDGHGERRFQKQARGGGEAGLGDEFARGVPPVFMAARLVGHCGDATRHYLVPLRCFSWVRAKTKGGMSRILSA